MIPVGITTYQRPKYLMRTLESFFHLNYERLDEFKFLIYVQGFDNETRDIIQNSFSRFHLIAMTYDNLGCAQGFNFIMHQCLEMETDLVMYLQDDWLSTEPITHYLDEIKKLFETYKDVGYIRLRSNQEPVFGKSRITNKGMTYTSAFPEDKYCHIHKVEHMHYTLNPTITRASVLKKMLPVTKEQDAMIKYHNLGLLGAQLKANCFRHIGLERATSIGKKGQKIWIK